jgi:hypothetical protein
VTGQFRRSSAVEQLTVNQLVVGSIPTAGAKIRLDGTRLDHAERRFRHLARSNPVLYRELKPSFEQEVSASKWIDSNDEAQAALNVSGPLVSRGMLLFGAKLGMALHYNETGAYLPHGGEVGVIWYSNEQALDGSVPQALFELLPERRTLRQGRVHAQEFFEYSSKETQEGGSSAHWATFGQSFMFYLFVGMELNMSSITPEQVFRPGCLKSSRPVETVLNPELWPDPSQMP